MMLRFVMQRIVVVEDRGIDRDLANQCSILFDVSDLRFGQTMQQHRLSLGTKFGQQLISLVFTLNQGLAGDRTTLSNVGQSLDLQILDIHSSQGREKLGLRSNQVLVSQPHREQSLSTSDQLARET